MTAIYQLPFPDKCRTDAFGVVTPERAIPHRGTDWGNGTKGKKIPAVTNGQVKLVHWSEALGWVLVQSTGDGYFVGYCHMKKQPSLKVGAVIKMGDIVGIVGNTGTASRGDHLHATLSNTVEGVFYGKVYDLYEHIIKHQAPKEAK